MSTELWKWPSGAKSATPSMQMVRHSAVVSARGQPDLGTGGSTFRIPDPHPPPPPKLAGWDPKTPEHCFGQAEDSLSNPGTLRLVNSFDQFGGPAPDWSIGVLIRWMSGNFGGGGPIPSMCMIAAFCQAPSSGVQVSTYQHPPSHPAPHESHSLCRSGQALD